MVYLQPLKVQEMKTVCFNRCLVCCVSLRINYVLSLSGESTRQVFQNCSKNMCASLKKKKHLPQQEIEKHWFAAFWARECKSCPRRLTELYVIVDYLRNRTFILSLTTADKPGMSDEAAPSNKASYCYAPGKYCARLPQLIWPLVSSYNAIHLQLSSLAGGQTAQHPAAGSHTRSQISTSYT